MPRSAASDLNLYCLPLSQHKAQSSSTTGILEIILICRFFFFFFFFFFVSPALLMFKSTDRRRHDVHVLFDDVVMTSKARTGVYTII